MGLLCFKKEKMVATNLLRYSRLSGPIYFEKLRMVFNGGKEKTATTPFQNLNRGQ